MKMSTKTLNRECFRTSRALEYFTEKELTLQTGHKPDRWPEVVQKELVDNSLDVCEGVGVLPEIIVGLESNSITVRDNGPGITKEIIESVLDYDVRVSSKDAYVSPTRGAQGNALKTVVAMPYVLSGCINGELEIITQGNCHNIKVGVDHIAQTPEISHELKPDGVVKNGTFIKIHWPDSSSLNTSELEPRFLQLLSGYSLFNPHATFELKSNSSVTRYERLSQKCKKWHEGEPTSPHWYTQEQLRGLMAAYITSERYGRQPKTVREFISEFRGLSSTQKQKAIINKLNLNGVFLNDLVKDGDINQRLVDGILEAMKSESKPVKPLNFGVLGEDHFKNWLEKYGGASKTFRYKRMAGVDDESNLPFLVEIAFAVREDQEPRKLVTGINWSPTLVDPFRQLADYGMGLESLLASLHIYLSYSLIPC